MIRRLILAAAMLLAGAAQAAPPTVKLWRLDCGTIQVNRLDAFSDTLAYPRQSRRLTDSCYLIRHADAYMLWDTGLPAMLKGAKTSTTDDMSPTLSATLVDQLARIGIKPEQIALIGISHNHFDHIGQIASFPAATVLIGTADAPKLWDPKAEGANALAPWLKTGRIEPVAGDRDIFGDGSVVMLDMPGHTPGHHALLVRLAKRGAVMLTGDLYHFADQVAIDGVPPFNTDRAQTLASMARMKGLVANLHATMIIGHEPRDIAKLPALPEGAQ